MEIIKAGDTVTMVGDRMSGRDNVWKFIAKVVDYYGYDEREMAGPCIVFTSGHYFDGLVLKTRRSNNIGQNFSEIEIS